jgi:hypothetical protein
MRVYHIRGKYFDIRPVIEQEVRKPAIVYISNWKGVKVAPPLAGFQLNDIDLGGPVIFARDNDDRNRFLAEAFPGRTAYKLDLDTRRPVEFDPLE